MYIHTGEKVIVSDKEIIGIFNTETLLLSEENSRFFNIIKNEHKTVILNKNNGIVLSKVSPFILIKRISPGGIFFWRRKYD